ncbi:MAG: hypothetical protein GEU93_19830 [Propionibacteriales bacterium]|nr:hypothetical protein [Propionibacteriales bacterium]
MYALAGRQATSYVMLDASIEAKRMLSADTEEELRMNGGPPNWVGSRLPEIVLPDQHGNPVDLQAVRGTKRALVVFYRSASW